MDVFNFHPQTKTLQISPQFWIYIVITVPLTALTGGFWWHGVRKNKKQRYRADLVSDMVV